MAKFTRCDRCNQELIWSKPVANIAPQYIFVTEDEIEQRWRVCVENTQREEFDLCKSCLKTIIEKALDQYDKEGK